MIGMRCVIGAAVLLLSACAHRPVEPRHIELYDAFQKYCVVTGGRYDAVAEAATADGFAHLQTVVQGLFDVKSTTWQKGKNRIVIGPVTRYRIGSDGNAVLVPYDPPQTIADGCSVIIAADRDDSRASFAGWAGVRPLKQENPTRWGDQYNDKYRFRLANHDHVAVDDRGTADALKAGGYWALLVYRRDHEYGAMLTHYYVPDTGSPIRHDAGGLAQ